MSAVTDEIERQVRAGRNVMARTFHLVEKRVGPAMSTRRAQIATGVVLATAVALGIGMLAYRRRRRRNLVARLQRVPDELVARAGAIKRALG